MYKTLQSTDEIPAGKFQSEATNWLRLFTTVYESRHVTPLMHLLSSHMAELLEIYKTIALFFQQGLEKLNDDVTKFYFRSTNHHDEALKQIPLKLNRLKELEDNGYSCLKLLHIASSLATMQEHVH